MQVSETNMPTFASDRPKSGVCIECGCMVEPYLRPALLDMPPKWFSPQDRCPKCEEQRSIREKARAEQVKIQEAFRNSRISPRFMERTFGNFEITSGTKIAYEAAINYKLGDGGFLFFGPVGTGKTHLAAAIANQIIGTVGTLFISCPEFLLELREAMNDRGKNQGKKTQLLNIAKTVQFLVLDDIGAEKTSDWVLETLFVIINHRYEFKLPTVFTSNCNVAELDEKLGLRIVSRIIEMCRCIEFAGPDYRFIKRKELKEAQHDS